MPPREDDHRILAPMLHRTPTVLRSLRAVDSRGRSVSIVTICQSEVRDVPEKQGYEVLSGAPTSMKEAAPVASVTVSQMSMT